MRSVVGSISLHLLLLWTTVNGCNLPCQNGSSCQSGRPDFSEHPNDDNGQPFDYHSSHDPRFESQHCACKEGWTGLYCERPFQKCSPQHAHACYHGGVCMEIQSGKKGVKGFTCDCRKTVDPVTGIKYVGRFCEHASLNECDANETGPQYCVNGGRCDSSLISPVHQCQCPEGFNGAQCEYYSDKVPTCANLKCENGGTCQVGLRNATETEAALGKNFDPNEGFLHCGCLAGYSGKRCENKHKKCGNKVCLHGADCVETQTSIGTKEFFCDCTTTETKATSFSGESCEHKATSFCTRIAGLNGHPFCVNNGTCYQKASGVYGCNCTEGFRGARCELMDGQEARGYESCSAPCQNGGECRKGAKDHGILKNYDGIDHLINSTSTEAIEHCECPEGYSGLLCEHNTSVCGEGQHVCFHGSKCVGDDENWKCDCQSGDDKAKAGPFCQHKATALCSPDGDEQDSVMFCVNGGTCVDEKTCQCAEGFMGRHCEFSRKDLLGSETSNDDEIPQPTSGQGKMHPASITFLTLGVLITTGILVTALVFILRGTREFGSEEEEDEEELRISRHEIL